MSAECLNMCAPWFGLPQKWPNDAAPTQRVLRSNSSNSICLSWGYLKQWVKSPPKDPVHHQTGIIQNPYLKWLMKLHTTFWSYAWSWEAVGGRENQGRRTADSTLYWASGWTRLFTLPEPHSPLSQMGTALHISQRFGSKSNSDNAQEALCTVSVIYCCINYFSCFQFFATEYLMDCSPPDPLSLGFSKQILVCYPLLLGIIPIIYYMLAIR